MLMLTPVLLLVLTALAVVILQAVRPGVGVAYLSAMIGSFFAWVLLLVLHTQLPLTISFSNWMPFQEMGGPLYFILDDISWPYAFALLTLEFAIILTAPARKLSASNPFTWAGIMAITALGFCAIASSSPLAIVLAWTIVDLMELLVMLATVRQSNKVWQVVVSFSARVFGSFVVLWALIISQSRGGVLTLVNPPSDIALFFLLAVGLRLGVLPFHLPYTGEHQNRRGLGTLLRLIAPASSLVILGRLPSTAVPGTWVVILWIFAIFAALYGAIMWLAAHDELNGRPYLLISLAGFTVGCVIQGEPSASMPWGIGLIAIGGLFSLFSARSRGSFIFPLLGILSLSGLPFSPAAMGIAGLIRLPLSAEDVFLMIAQTILLLGFLKYAFSKGEPLQDSERWVQVAYPLGLAILAFSSWITLVLQSGSLLTLGLWWASLIPAAVAIGIRIVYVYAVQPRLASRRDLLNPSGTSWNFGRNFLGFLRLEWLYRFLWQVFGGLQRIVEIFTNLLEGEGGVLWTLLLLALLISLLRTGGLQ